MALTDKLTAIADAIREKTGTTEELTLDAMATAISGISGGGAEIETCTVTLFYGNNVAAITYNALVDGKQVAKVLGPDDEGDEGFIITDIVKGSTLSLFSEGGGSLMPVGDDVEELYADTYYQYFCYVINGDCELSFVAD